MDVADEMERTPLDVARDAGSGRTEDRSTIVDLLERAAADRIERGPRATSRPPEG